MLRQRKKFDLTWRSLTKRNLRLRLRPTTTRMTPITTKVYSNIILTRVQFQFNERVCCADYVPREKQYAANSEEDDDDYETRSGKYFKAPATEGNFKPSTSFPFKQYDEKFGKYSSQNRNAEGDKKPKYHDYSSSNDEDDDEQAPSTKYNSDRAPSKSFYSRQEDEENDDRHGYERQKTEETTDDANASKYLDKNIDEEFESLYRKKLPRQGKCSLIKYCSLKERTSNEAANNRRIHPSERSS